VPPWVALPESWHARRTRPRPGEASTELGEAPHPLAEGGRLAPRARCLSPVAQRPTPRKDAGRALSPRDISPGLGPQEVYNAERPAFGVLVL
jgi:hypothetical protein